MIKRLFIIMMLFLFSLNILAQTTFSIYPSEMLVYTKMNADNTVFMMQFGDKSIAYALEEGECGKISRDGRYIAVTSEQPENIKIVHLGSKRQIAQINWDLSWSPCEFYWRKEGILSIYTQNQNNAYFKLENGNLISTTLSPDVPPTYPELPNFFSATIRPLILQSPSNSNIYLYEECPTEFFPDLAYCSGYITNIVLYDISNQTEITTLESNEPAFMRGYRINTSMGDNIEDISAPLVAWSPDGRYIAYFHWLGSFTGAEEGEIIIYDLQMNRYIRGARELYFPHIWRSLQWSDENVLIIPRAGLFSDIYNFEFYDSLTLFSFLHADTETYATATALFDTLSNPIFAPDSRSITFIGTERVIPEQSPTFFNEYPYRGDLILISTTTGEHTVIDTNVTEIITWRSICDFTPIDTASLISTMQTEPYSVICLVENGQYDLTAPLPTVTGDITIIGNGASITMTGGTQIFNVAETGGLTLKNITVSGGNAVQGGAIFNAGTLALEDVVLENNSATDGGAIYNTGSLTMTRGALQNNTATNFGGGIYNHLGEMTVDGVNIRDNNAVEGSGVYQAPDLTPTP